jgi:hypothetical protein
MAAISSGTVSFAESAGALAPPHRMLNEDLTGLDDRMLLGIVRLLPRASERRRANCWSPATRAWSGPACGGT